MKNSTNNTTQLKAKRGAETLKIPFSLLLIEEGFNIRYDYGDINALKDSIVENGQQEPIKVMKITSGENKGKFKVIEGHRRTTAIGQAIAEGHDIAFVIALSTKKTAEEQLIEMLTAGIHKKELRVIEVAEGFKRMINFGYKNSEIARKVGKTHTTVANYLLLTSLTKKVKNIIYDNKLKESDAIKLMKQNDKDEQKVEDIVLSALEASQIDQKVTLEQESTEKSTQEKDASESKPESKKPIVRTLNSTVLGVKPLKPIQKLNKALDIISEKIEEKKLNVKDESKIETLVKLANQLKQKDTDFNSTIDILLELI